jgi:hypothetical protein
VNAVVESKAGAHALAQVQTPGRMAVAEIIGHVAMVQEVMRAVMKPDVHYGTIPGTDKPTLLKSGAEVLCMAFRIADSYLVEDLSTDIVVRYRVTCTGTHQVTGHVLGTGMGEASSGEEKYKWVKAYPEEWEATPPNLRRTKHGWDKAKKQKYEVLQVRTEPANLANTILKMANKRAKMAMVLNVTAASDCFSQDLEDMDDALRDHLTRRGEDGQEEGQQAGKSDTSTLPPYPDDKITANLKEWATAIKSGKAKSVDQIVAFIKSKNSLTSEQEKRIRDGCAAPAAAPTGDAPTVTAAAVLAKMEAAKTSDDLDAAAGLIGAIQEIDRGPLNKRYDELRNTFTQE